MSAGIGNPFKRQHFHIGTKELRTALKIGSDASHIVAVKSNGSQTILAFPEALLSDSSNRDGQMERGEIVFDSSYNQDGY